VCHAQETTHCQTASLDFASCDKFQQYPREFAFLKRREGYLYGRFLEDGNVTGTLAFFLTLGSSCVHRSDSRVCAVEYIYEPPQEQSPSGVIVMDDPEEAKLVETIANALGLQKVTNVVFSCPTSLSLTLAHQSGGMDLHRSA
jgi:hypothetical protein